MAKLKRVTPKKEKKEPGPVTGPTTAENLGAFMADWGRLVVPVGLAAVLATLRLTGVIDETGLGFAIGSLFMLAVLAAFGFIVFRNLFPFWVRAATVLMFLAVLAGAGITFHETVYPGAADFSTTLGEAGESVDLDATISGSYRVEVYASSVAAQPSSRAREGKFRLLVAGNRIAGQFSDMKRNVRSGRRGSKQVETKHLTDTYSVEIQPGTSTVELLWLDKAIGPHVRVSLFKPVLPPVLVYLLLGLSMLLAIGLDAWYQDQTIRWRLAPWIGMILAFMLVFNLSYEKGGVSNTAVWSVVFGSVIGFTLGWAVSLVTRKVVRMAQAR